MLPGTETRLTAPSYWSHWYSANLQRNSSILLTSALLAFNNCSKSGQHDGALTCIVFPHRLLSLCDILCSALYTWLEQHQVETMNAS